MRDPDRKTVRATIAGRVQGVGFREWTRRQASGLDLSGWVRNASDGTVIALLSGAAEAVDKMVARLHEGPRSAEVREVAILAADDEAPAPGFSILS